jgi:DNA modification methylase
MSAAAEPKVGPIVLLDGRVTIHLGDVLAMLRAMPDDSVDCVITSPPYWGLRDYGVDGQIGMERTLGEHLDMLVAVFEEVRRVLKPAGTLWLNYGDCYATQPNGRSAADTKAAGDDDRTFRDKPMSTVGPVYGAKPGSQEPLNGTGRRGGGNLPTGPVYDPDGGSKGGGKRGANKGNANAPGPGRVVAGGYLKPKDLCLIPERLIIALQEAGWWVRAKCTWGKPNAMPDSSGDYRPATAHEELYCLAKNADAGGWWLARDTKEVTCAPDLGETVIVHGKNGDKELNRWRRLGHYYNSGAVRQSLASTSVDRLAQDTDGQGGSTRANGGARPDRPMKAVGAKPDKQAGHSRRHAGFNERWDKEQAERRRAVPPRHEGQINHEHLSDVARGAGRLLRTVEPAPAAVWTMPTAAFREAHFATFPPELVERCLDAGCPPGGHVLDPFGGSGTTALVALAKGRTCDLIELNPDYAAIARHRIEGAWQGDVERTVARLKRTGVDEGAGPLFETPDQAVVAHDGAERDEEMGAA